MGMGKEGMGLLYPIRFPATLIVLYSVARIAAIPPNKVNKSTCSARPRYGLPNPRRAARAAGEAFRPRRISG